ncbi:MAG: hypothetical protein M9955_19810 [Rhizobiaceae bacterium]|nr:hypothetical protein [Rhizobiaceae bacterium]
MNALAPAPEYRALMLFDRLPAGCISFQCKDVGSMPHVRPGEFVVVDTAVRTPIAGELFVIKFGPELGHHRICMVRRGAGFGRVDGWRVGAVTNDLLSAGYQKLRSRTDLTQVEKNILHIQAHNAVGAWTEGPYDDTGKSYEHLCSCLVGQVIGLYQPKGGAT